MNRKRLLVLACCLLSLSGCKKKAPAAPMSGYVSTDSASVGGSRAYEARLTGSARVVSNAMYASLGMAKAYAAAPQKFVAVSHKFEIVAPDSDLPRNWQAVIDFCATIPCEVVSSSISSKTRIAPPSGTISLRVSPDDAKKLFAFLEKQGAIVQHSTESVDKTTDVVDTEAKIKNLTTFRDNLRTMLAKPTATVKDSIEIQEQLTEVQSQLDGETARRKILANETEKVAVEISFRVEIVESRRSAWTQIGNAFRESGEVLADSIYWMILAIVAILPWGILAIPLVWLLVRVWHRLRRKREPSVQTAGN